MRSTQITALYIAALFLHGCIKAPTPEALRQKELARILVPLLYPGDESESHQRGAGVGNPTNRLAVAAFITRHAGTEEALRAQVWLVFSQHNTETSWEPAEGHPTKAERIQTLERVISSSSIPATIKMAKMQRVNEFLDAPGSTTEFEKQVAEILTHIADYQSERDWQYRRLTGNMSAYQLEPELRILLVMKACHELHLDKALVYAEDLKRRYPVWSKHENIDSAIWMLNRGQTPYPWFP